MCSFRALILTNVPFSFDWISGFLRGIDWILFYFAKCVIIIFDPCGRKKKLEYIRPFSKTNCLKSVSDVKKKKKTIDSIFVLAQSAFCDVVLKCRANKTNSKYESVWATGFMRDIVLIKKKNNYNIFSFGWMFDKRRKLNRKKSFNWTILNECLKTFIKSTASSTIVRRTRSLLICWFFVANVSRFLVSNKI